MLRLGLKYYGASVLASGYYINSLYLNNWIYWWADISGTDKKSTRLRNWFRCNWL